MLAASRLLRAHNVSSDDQVPLLEIVEAEGIAARFAPLPQMAGSYLSEEDYGIAGMLINTRLPWPKQRYTIGHELGHHVFGHGSRSDKLSDTDWLSTDAPASASQDELVAEAFAAWLLMPKSNVVNAIHQLGVPTIADPVDVYRLSLLLGSSYRATCYHLAHLKKVGWPAARKLAQIEPKRIKQTLLADRSVYPGPSDVHLVDAEAMERIHVRSGDVLVFTHGLPSAASVPSFVTLRSDRALDWATIGPADVANPARSTSSAVVDAPRGCVEMVLHHPLTGVSESWFS